MCFYPSDSQVKLTHSYSYHWTAFDISGQSKPATNGRDDPATLICVSQYFSSKPNPPLIVDIGLV
jgi:hypothetical protein